MPIRVLVVDDSPLMRRLITSFLEKESDMVVVDTAADGEEAVRKVQSVRPDVVTMDVEMPVLNGIDALERMMAISPVPVIMLSAHTKSGANATMKSLALGAVDFVAKPTNPGEMKVMVEDLLFKIRAAAQALVKRTPSPVRRAPVRSKKDEKKEAGIGITATGHMRGQYEVVVIGSSTGGPSALHQIVRQLPQNLPVGVVIVQHIPKGFSESLALHLDKKAAISVKHAEKGDRVRPGLVLVSPAGFDLTFHGKPGAVEVDLNPGKGPVRPGNFRPSVDLVMKSAAETFGRKTMGVLLTGMGRDGALGMQAIREKNGYTIAEAEETCVVYGMPRAAVEIGAAVKVLPLHEIAAEIVRALKRE
ncbi:MAG: protein-glutamate methylesterase/protein-glutamine glutaminase [Bacillota bacterium]